MCHDTATGKVLWCKMGFLWWRIDVGVKIGLEHLVSSQWLHNFSTDSDGPNFTFEVFSRGGRGALKCIKRHAYWVVVGSASIVVVSKHFQAYNCWTFRQWADRWGPFDWLELRNAAGLGVPKGMTSWLRILAEWDNSKMLEECKDFVYIIHLYIPWISTTCLVHFLRFAH